MDKLDINECFFHSINVKDTNKSEIECLSDILDNKAILSRRLLKKINREKYDMLMNHSTRTNWNGENFISIASPLQRHEEFPGHLHGEEVGKDTLNIAYDSYPSTLVSIMLSPRLLKEAIINLNPQCNLYGEVQVKYKIPSEYFLGISIPQKLIFLPNNLDSFSEYNNYIKNLPFHKLSDVNELEKVSIEEYFEREYSLIIMIDKVLKERNSSLKMYYLETGEVITIDGVLEKISKLKKFVLNGPKINFV